MIMPDKALFEVADNKFDVVILPGGLQGANSLAAVSSHHLMPAFIRIPSIIIFQFKASIFVKLIFFLICDFCSLDCNFILLKFFCK